MENVLPVDTSCCCSFLFRHSSVLPTSHVFRSGYIKRKSVLDFFYKIIRQYDGKRGLLSHQRFIYSHLKWFSSQSHCAYYYNYLIISLPPCGRSLGFTEGCSAGSYFCLLILCSRIHRVPPARRWISRFTSLARHFWSLRPLQGELDCFCCWSDIQENQRTKCHSVL